MRMPGDMRGDAVNVEARNAAPQRAIPTFTNSNYDAVPADDPERQFFSTSNPPPPAYQPRPSSRDRRSGEVILENNNHTPLSQFNLNPPPQKDPFRNSIHRDYEMENRYPTGRDHSAVTADYAGSRNYPEAYSHRNRVGNGTGARREQGREWTACHKICLAVAIVHLIVIIIVVVWRVNYANSD